MSADLSITGGRIALQVESNPALDIAGAQLAKAGLPVIGLLAMGQMPPDIADYARWLELDRRQAAAKPLIQSLLERTDVILGSGFDHFLSTDHPPIRALIKPATPLVSAIRAGLSMPGIGDMVTKTPAIDLIAGQALALRILSEMHLPKEARTQDAIDFDAEDIAAELLAQSGGHRIATPPAGRFATSDEPIVLMAGNDEAFAALISMINRPDMLQDFRYKTEAAREHNGAALHALLEHMIIEESSEEWLARLKRYGIPACRAADPKPQMVSSKAFMSGEIACELGFRMEQIAGWQQRGVIGVDRLETDDAEQTREPMPDRALIE